MIEFRMPSLGADMESGTLREWRMKRGDTVKRGNIIADVETQKGLIEIEIFDEGTIHEFLLKEDEKVPVGTVMALILEPGETPPAVVPRPAVKAPTKESHVLRASPLAKRIATQNGIDLSTLMGSGPDGAITKEDVDHAIAARVAPTSNAQAPVKSAVAGAAEGMRMAVAAAMSRSNKEIPHYYLGTSINMQRALSWLKETNAKLPVKDRILPGVLLIKAVAKALCEVPELNSYWQDELQRKESIHIGFVVSLRTGGIVVPAIHDADKKSLNEIMATLSDLIIRARTFKLRSSELSEGTFTISSLGDQGVETVYGVIYPPQVGLVGFGGVTERCWVENGKVEARPVLSATLSGDHRATDGNTGSRFLQAINEHLQHPEEL